jgi:EAL domain-containing protein (putative c-di-GMP-specific phosphodiesterase class I)
LRKEGIRFALDDFGTGYSSLTYLKKLELDIIKIDRAFIQDIINDKNDAALVDAILSIAHNFNMKVIAEGVEELNQVKQLSKMGCKYFQGYYFSRPIPLNEFEEFLKK